MKCTTKQIEERTEYMECSGMSEAAAMLSGANMNKSVVERK